MNVAERKILNHIKELVTQKAPGAKLYLYGSRARGTATHTSDWDLLILLNKDHITLEDEQSISDPLYDLEFDLGEVISPMIYSEKEWNAKYTLTPFYRNVMQEARLL